MNSGDRTASAKSVSSALAVLYNNKGNKYFLYNKKGIIGRSVHAFLCITEIYISRTHCVIEYHEEMNKFTICDLSNSGTWVNDVRLKPNTTQDIKHLDRIMLADREEHTFVFLANKKFLGIQYPSTVKVSSPLTNRMIDLNKSHSSEKEVMEKELDQVGLEMKRLRSELQALKEQGAKIEKERYEASLESTSNKEQAAVAESKLKETMEEKEKVIREYEDKIADVVKKVEELQENKHEMEKRHQAERDELESKCKAEIEELKNKLEKSESQNQQFTELQNKLEDIKKVLLESELEQQRLFEAKVEVETKLESKIVDLTNEKENKAEIVKELEMKLKENELKLREKEELEERVKREMEGLEDDMMCSICAEFYIEPTALNCGHMFCKMCINEWSKKKKICPMCRAKIVAPVRIYNMDSVIQRNVRLMSAEAQARREALIEERKKGKTPQKKKSSKKRRLEATATAHQAGDTSSNAGPSHRRRIDVPTALTVPAPLEDDPFQGWVTTNLRIQGRNEAAGRFSPVSIAAVDLTNVPMVNIPVRVLTRMHTATSDANTTIDLTDL